MDRQERIELLARLRKDAQSIASHFSLNFKSINAEFPNVKSRYGLCDSEGQIKIRLTNARSGEALKYSSLIDTLCHELAHLRHFNHGPEFRAFFWELLNWARSQGIYCPRSKHGQFTQMINQPAELKPPKRNGVPVFTQSPFNNDDSSPPWERRAKSLSISISKKSPSSKSNDATSGNNRVLEKQLDLFS